MKWNISIGFAALCVGGLVACSAADPGSSSLAASAGGDNGRALGSPGGGVSTDTQPRGGAGEGTSGAGGTSSGGDTTSGETSGAGGTSGGSAPTGGSTVTGTSPVLGGCAIYPADNPWNRDVSADPVDTDAMARVMPNMLPTTALHPDWGLRSDGDGIPFTVVSGGAKLPMSFVASWGPSESDPLAGCSGSRFCYPIPENALIEGGPSAPSDADRHVLVLDTTGAPNNCTLYELYHAFPNGAGWTADNGAIFHLGSDALRTDGWTSADAAGLPVLPGLVRYDEAMSGEIKHAIRFTMHSTFNGYIHPATHAAGLSNSAEPAMGLRMRLKAGVDISKFKGPMLAVVKAMKKYGIILADNGSNWYITGESNDAWASQMDAVVSQMRLLHGSDFEIVKSGTVSTKGL